MSGLHTNQDVNDVNDVNDVVEVDADIADLIPTYLERGREAIAAVEEALRRQRFDDIRQSGHRLRGTGSMYGFPRLTALGGALEAAATIAAVDAKCDKCDANHGANHGAIQTAAAALAHYLDTVVWRPRPVDVDDSAREP